MLPKKVSAFPYVPDDQGLSRRHVIYPVFADISPRLVPGGAPDTDHAPG